MKNLRLISFLLLAFTVANKSFGQSFTGPTTVCKDVSETYSYSDDVTFDNAVWTITGGGTITKITGLTQRGIKWSSNGTVTVKLYRNGGVVSQDSKSVNVEAPGTINAPSSVCLGNSITVGQSGSTGSYVWQISTDGGSSWSTISSASTLTHTPTQDSQYKLVLSSCARGGSSNIETVTVVPQSNAGSILASISSVCNSGTVTLTKGSTTGALSWERRYKDGSGGSWTSWYTFSNSTSSSVNHSLAVGSQDRYYEFRLAAKNGICNWDYSNTRNVTVSKQSSPGTMRSLNGNTFCNSGTVNLEVSGSWGTKAWQRRYKNGSGGWTAWANISTSSANSISTSVATGSNYDRYYEYRLRTINGSCSYQYGNTVSVQVDHKPDVRTLTATSEVCLSGTVNLSLSSAPIGAISWQSRYKNGASGSYSSWSTISTSIGSSINTSVATGAYDRYYQFRVIGSHGSCANDYSNTETTIVYHSPVPGPLSVSGSNSFCGSGTVSLALGSSVGEVTWRQRSKEGASGSWTGWTWFARAGGSITYDVSSSGTDRYYEFKAETRNGTCGWEESNVVSATVYQPSAVGILSTSTAALCSSGTVNLTLSSATGTRSWQSRYKNGASGSWTGWSTFTTNTSNSTSTAVSAGSVDRYYEFRTVVDNSICSSVTSNTASALVNAASNAGSVNVAGGTEFYGSSGAITLYTYSTVGTVSYQYSTNGTNWYSTSSNPPSVSQTRQYRSVAINGNCPAAYSNPITVNVYDIPLINLGGPSSIMIGKTTQLSVPGNYHQYQWAENGVNIPGATGQTLTVTRPGQYYIKVKGSASAPWSNSNPIEITSALANQPKKVNYKAVTSVFKEGFDENDDFYALAPGEVRQTIEFMDGYGRTVQQVAIGQSPTQKDIVQPYAYNAAGRMEFQYLGYVAANSTGKYRPEAVIDTITGNYTGGDQFAFYQQGGKLAVDTQPYSQSIYEDSPLGRITEQGGVGQSWDAHGIHATSSSYRVNNNASSDPAIKNIKKWTTFLGPSSFYGNNQLSISMSKDENGNHTYIYTDKLGRTVLKRVQLDESQEGVSTPFLETYYVYDVRGNLAMQIPPKAVSLLNAGTTWTTAFRDEWCFTYTYDQQNRLVEKKSPDAAVVYYGYDPLDRLVLTQDGFMRANNQWAFIKYDRKGRAVMSGIYTNTTHTSRSAVQTNVLDPLYASGAWYEQRGSALHGYTNQSFPTQNGDGSALEILTVGYYDNHDFDNNGTADYSYTAQGLTGEGTAVDPFGLATGSKTRILGTSDWIYGYVFYDKYARAIQSRSNNHLSLTINDLSTNVYAFDGTLTYNKTTHNGAGGQTVTTLQRVEYDHAGRVMELYHKINSEPEKLVVAYEYNELGQLIDKSLHDQGGGNFLQSIDYRYNIKGWLKSINNADLDIDASNNDDNDDFFGMELVYNTIETGLNDQSGDSRYWNGNISATMWKGPGDNATPTGGTEGRRGYKYKYDKTDRLTSAKFREYGTAAWDQGVNTLNVDLTYDANGNIKTLTRNKALNELDNFNLIATPLVMDDLTYTYSVGNKLQKVTDSATDEGGFDDQANLATEYQFDANGSLIQDKNKKISNIEYNILGKPVSITFGDGRIMNYTYNAAGAKLKVEKYDGATLLSTTDYTGGYVYTDGALSFFSGPEGRIVKKGSTYERQYVITDHQGNTRVLFSSATAAPEVFTANFEAADNTDFQNYPTGANRSSFNLFDHTDAGTTYTHSNLLNGGTSGQVGLSKSLKVYPGDKVKVEAFAKYYNEQATPTDLSGFAGALTSAFGVSGASVGEAAQAFEGLNSYGSMIAGGGGGGSTTHPKVFVTILLFDKDHQLVDATFDQIDGGEQIGATPTAHDHMMAEYEVTVPGYAYVFVSNENPTYVEAYFDDVVVTHTPTNILQYNEYYPFGLQTASSWTRDLPAGQAGDNANQFLYNAGNELNEESGWYETFYRGYDPALGRMLQVDPMVDKYASLSPYNYAFNDPVYWNDPSGADPDLHSKFETWRNSGGFKGRGISSWRDRGPEDAHGGMYGSLQSGSGNHWADGSFYSDWSLHGGSQLYRDGRAAGYSDYGGILHRTNSDGTRTPITDHNGRLGYWEDEGFTTFDYGYINGEKTLMQTFGVKTTFVTDQSSGVMQAGFGEGAMDIAKISLYMMETSNAVNEAHGVKNLADVFRKNKTILRNKHLGRATKNLPKAVVNAQKGLNLAKAVGRGLARPFFFAGVGLSVIDVSMDNSTSNVVLNIIDTAVAGGALILAASPVGWAAGVVAGIYFTGRLAYDLYEAYNDGN